MRTSLSSQSDEFVSSAEEDELKITAATSGTAAATAATAAASIRSSENLRQALKLRPAPGEDMPLRQPEFLLLLHAVGCGQPAAEPADGAPICQLAYLVYDVQRRKVMTLAQHPVKPLLPPGLAAVEGEATTREDGRATVSAECTKATGITDEWLDAAEPLEHCLAEMDRTLRQVGAHPDLTGRDLRTVTDGPAPLRCLLHPDAAASGIRLPEYCFAFHDLRKEFARARRRLQVPTALEEMLDDFGLKQESSEQQQRDIANSEGAARQSNYSSDCCVAMSRIIGCLLADGHKFAESEKISRDYRPALIRRSDPIGTETVVRLRGLPWQVGDVEVARDFFSGLNVSPGGVALVLSRSGGRRNGEALVRFDSVEQRDLALLRHRRHLGRRYIEVFKAGSREFLAAAAASTAEAEAFLARLDGSGQQLLRMRGLPYSVTAEQVLEFFAKSACPVQFGRDGLLFAQRPDGRATGDAFAMFASADVAERALERGHRQHIGSRYVELFKSTPAELNQVLGGFQQQQQQQHSSVKQQQPQPPPPPLPQHSQKQWVQQQQHRHLLRIGGMPAEATVADILGFLEQHAAGIAYQGVHQVLNHLGRPTGEAVIEMTSDRAAQLTCAAKDGQQFWLFDGRSPAGVFVDVQRCPSLPAGSEVTAPPPPPPPPPLPHLLPPSPLGSHPAFLSHFPFLALGHSQSPFLIPFLATYPQPHLTPAIVPQQVSLYPAAAGSQPSASQTVLAI